jgi:hypothetical protein
MDGPYIGQIGDDVVLVAGGNGYGANCCDEIGRIGAKLATRFLPGIYQNFCQDFCLMLTT